MVILIMNIQRREKTMETISPKRLGFSLACTFTILYIGCVFVMMMVPKEVAISFFNSLMHGVDVTSIMRWEMPLIEMIIGILETFILSWFVGATIAVFYNLGAKKS